DAARRHVEPCGAAPDLDLLAIGEPVALLPQRVVEHDAHVLELGVEVGAGREVERHPDEIGGGRVEIESAYDAREVEALGPHAQRHDAHLALGERDDGGVAEREVVQAEPGGRERVRHVPHFVPLAQPDGGAEVVLDDAQVVAVVVDVGGELGLIAPADDALLAARRGPPVHFQLQLVRLDEPRRVGESFAEGAQKEQEAVGLGLVIVEGGVGGGAAAAQRGAARQRERRVGIPRLGVEPDREAETGQGEPGGDEAHIPSTPLAARRATPAPSSWRAPSAAAWSPWCARSCSTPTRRWPRSSRWPAPRSRSCWNRWSEASAGPATPSWAPSRARCGAAAPEAARSTVGPRRAAGRSWATRTTRSATWLSACAPC